MPLGKRGPYEVVSSREVYRGARISLRCDHVIQPGGSERDFDILEMVEGSTVLALSDDHTAYLTREYKYAVGRECLELISGAIDEGETALEAAQREIKEEAGLTASEWIPLGVLDPFTSTVRSPNHMFLALGAVLGEPDPDEGEVIHTVAVPFSQAVEMVLRGDITHGASCVAILKAERLLRERR
ncbi:MAG TPA: NUDIX hydrolase [Bryobacteraceae bacterium]|nr:NUDIX hydrolase [Bryobacteraceae bacterium]